MRLRRATVRRTYNGRFRDRNVPAVHLVALRLAVGTQRAIGRQAMNGQTGRRQSRPSGTRRHRQCTRHGCGHADRARGLRRCA
jgi:hypothetical protein